MTPDWLSRAPVAPVLEALEGTGHRAFVVGGAVRNAIMGRPVRDFDVATSATPDEVAAAFGKRARVVPTGVGHGTVTVVLGAFAVEVTTFRRDVATDGRRAVVAFSTDPGEDARRRDFTMNAIYLDRRGAVLDPVGGVADARAGRLRFIGAPDDRIREDYLRALRYFRLFAEYGDPTKGFDTAAVSAIAANLDGLALLSVERVTDEVLKLLAAPDPAFAIAGMERSGVLTAILPGAATTAFFELVHIEAAAQVAPDPIRRLAALTFDCPLRLSRKDAQKFDRLQALRGAATGIAEIAWREGATLALDTALLRAAGLSQPFEHDRVGRDIAHAAAAVRPISARDLMDDLRGRALGEALDRATAAWIASDFTLTREALLAIARNEG